MVVYKFYNVLRIFIIIVFCILQCIFAAETEWERYGINPLRQSQIIPSLSHTNTLPHKFKPSSTLFRSPYIFNQQRQQRSEQQKRLNINETPNDILIDFDNIDINKRANFLKRQFGRDSSSLRFGKRGFFKEYQNFL